MSLLRICASLQGAPRQCRWALVGPGLAPVTGEGPLAQLPQRVERVQLVLQAADVLITRARLPHSARRRAGSVLAYAVEEETVGEPDANQVSWLGRAADADALAVADRRGLKAWREALGTAGIRGYEVHCESLMLPWTPREWSLAWNGRDGFVRSGEFEGAATDCGDRQTPPLSLRLLLEEAIARNQMPESIAIYEFGTDIPADAAPDLDTWQRELGVALRRGGIWDARTAPPDAGVSLAQERQPWGITPAALTRLRPAAWIAGLALILHALALIADWSLLATEQRSLRRQMEARFRSAFPDAVAVVDPALQMRRKLADARHAAGQPDSSDFLPMFEKIAVALKELPSGGLRIAAYENGRMTLELAALDEAGVRRIVAKLLQAGVLVEPPAAATRGGAATVILSVRSS